MARGRDQTGLSASALAQLVLDRMTVAEKLGEVVLYSSGLYENVNAGVARLCIPSLAVQDGPQGVAYGALHVTQLPAPLGVAATFNTSIASSYGQVEGAESLAKGYDTVQGPTLNIDRVPESGRTYEGFGEDPVLASAMGVADIEGIQSTGSMAMAKEFAVYSQETDRGVLNEEVSERAIQELYLPPFKAAVTQAHVSTIMCAYPRLNGTFQCQQPQLVSLLDQWGFNGFVRSDLGAVHDPVAALSAGTDLIKPENAGRTDSVGTAEPPSDRRGQCRSDQGSHPDVRLRRDRQGGPSGFSGELGRFSGPHRGRAADRGELRRPPEEQRLGAPVVVRPTSDLGDHRSRRELLSGHHADSAARG